MRVAFAHTWKRMRPAMWGWGLSLAALTGMVAAFYDNLVAVRDQFEALLAAYPQAMLAFFTREGLSMLTPEGFLHAEVFSYLPVLLGIHAVLVGANLIRADEAQGVLDLLLARPITRQAFFAARVLAALATLVGILACIAAGLAVGQALAEHVDFAAAGIGRALFAVGVQWALFFALALALSLALPSRHQAAAISGGLLVASFFLPALARLHDALEPWARWSPLQHYPGGQALVQPLDGGAQAALLLIAAGALGVALLLFLRRDVRVHG